MRIVFVNDRLGYSSTTSYSLDLIRALKDRGHPALLCTSGGEFVEIFKAAGIDCYPIRFNFFSFRKLTELLREFRPQLLHVLSLRSYGSGLKISDRLGVPHVVTVHHVPSSHHPPLGHDLLTGVIAVNEAVREALVNELEVPKDLIRVIPSAVNLERFAPREPVLDVPGRLPVIGSIGRLETVKGHAYFVEAARKLLDGGREAQFVIVGEGPEEPALRRQIKSLQLEKHLTICPPLPDLAELLATFDIIVLPTLRGGASLSALEAMAMARPVVASAGGELMQIIADNVTGILVNERDADAIADRIARLLDDPEQARELGARARRSIEERFALTPMIDGTEEFLGNVIEERV